MFGNPHFWRASELESCAPGLPLFRGGTAQGHVRTVVIVVVHPAFFHPADHRGIRATILGPPFVEGGRADA